ncbi:MAG: hypothetical protein H7X92_14805 [Chitinophagales bacterium]|nr:hypothetical protein [Hyphomicrobiales bacterium]
MIGVAAIVFHSGVASAQDAVWSAYFGVDNVRPARALQNCNLPMNETFDGIPVVFSSEIDQTTLSASDFSIELKDGTIVTPVCATLGPSDEENEDRTVLLAGQFGDTRGVRPVRVTIVGSLLDESGRELKGRSTAVTGFGAGPSVMLAEQINSAELEVAISRSTMGPKCPARTTVQAVRLIWNGGVTRDGTRELNDSDRQQYVLRLKDLDGTVRNVTPFAMGDLDDGITCKTCVSISRARLWM